MVSLAQSPVVIPAQWLPKAYAFIMATGLLLALLLGIRLHFSDLVMTHCETPEYWPSISATTGDFLVERTVWRVFVVFGFGIRIVASCMLYRLFSSAIVEAVPSVFSASHGGNTKKPHWMVQLFAACDFLRIVCALGWTFVTSQENLIFHEMSFAFYMIGGFVLQIVQVFLVKRLAVVQQQTSNTGEEYAKFKKSEKLKKIGLVGQTCCALLVAKFFIDHHATCQPGMYSRSTMCEWGFAFFNLFFDYTQWLELDGQFLVLGGGAGAVSVQSDLSGIGNSNDGVAATVAPLSFANRPSNTALWFAEVFMGYFMVSSTVQLYQNVYFIPMVAMQFTPEVGLVFAALAPLLLRSAALRGLGSKLHFALWHRAFHFAPSAAPPGWLVCYGCALLSYFSFDVTRDSGNKLKMVGIGPLFWYLGFYLRMQSTNWGAVVTDRSTFRYAPQGSSATLNSIVGQSASAANSSAAAAAIPPSSQLEEPNREEEQLPPAATASSSTAASSQLAHLHHSLLAFCLQEDTARLIYSIPLGCGVSMIGRILYVSLDPLHVDPLLNALLGVCGGVLVLLTLYRGFLYSPATILPTASSCKRGGGGYHRPADLIRNGIEVVTSEDATFSGDADDNSNNNKRKQPILTPDMAAQLQAKFCPSTVLSGICLGATVQTCIGVASTANVIFRFLGVEPYPYCVLAPVVFLLGVSMHRGVICGGVFWLPGQVPEQQKAFDNFVSDASFSKQHAGSAKQAIYKAFVRLCAATALSFSVLYWGATQSNRMFLRPDLKGPLPDHSTPVSEVDISQWYVEEMSGAFSVVVALFGGLAFLFCLGVTLPHVLTFTFVLPRAFLLGPAHHNNNSAEGSSPLLFAAGSHWYSSVPFWGFLSGVFVVMLNVYVVCFPFVPGGPLVRDRMWLVMGLSLLMVWLPLLQIVKHLASVSSAPSSASSVQEDDDSSSSSAASFVIEPFRLSITPPPLNVIKTLFFLLLVAMIGRELGTPGNRDANGALAGAALTKPSGPGVDTTTILAVAEQLYEIDVIGKNALGSEPNVMFNNKTAKDDLEEFQYNVSRYEKRVASKKRDALKKQHGDAVLSVAAHIAPVSAMIWTIHFGLDNFGVDSVMRLAAKVRKQDTGIIGLLETDSLRLQNGNRDVVEYIAFATGYTNIDYGPTTFDSTFGCALITKYRILHVKRYVLPSPMGELACLIHAQLDVGGMVLHTYVGHWGNTDHVQDTKLQSQFLGNLAKENPGPSVFLGYLTTHPNKGNYKYFVAPTSSHSHHQTTKEGEKRAIRYKAHTGLFFDTAQDMFRGRGWSKQVERYGAGYVDPAEKNDEEKEGADNSNKNDRLDESQYKRPPAGEDPRVFLFPDTRRFSTAHPKWEYVDRYCQYILYKSGLEEYELSSSSVARAASSSATKVHLELLDWWRVLDIDELSDTEIQVVHFGVRSG